jgi:hypothetical protein
MADLKTAEHIAHFMIGNLKLSRYDEKFIESIQHLAQVTTNQVELFYKIICKYRRQFIKFNLNVDELIYLPWTIKVVESQPDYTDGHVAIVNDTITFKCPFNRNFITEFRKIENNTFIWNRDERQYVAKFGTHQLKVLLPAAAKYFSVLRFCHITEHLISELSKYETATYWQPTLVRRNGNLLIAASNQSLDDALYGFSLSVEPTALAYLTKHGVTISSDLINDDVQAFASTFFNKVEITEALNIVPLIAKLGFDYVYLSGSAASPIRRELKRQLMLENITVGEPDVYGRPPEDFKKSTNSVIIKFRLAEDFFAPHRVGKIIQLVNSQPINIK